MGRHHQISPCTSPGGPHEAPAGVPVRDPGRRVRPHRDDRVRRDTQVKVRLVRAIKNLPVAAETRTGYERAKFRLWVDADHDCRDTRDEVLAAESLVPVSGCDIQAGKWRSYYDGVV